MKISAVNVILTDNDLMSFVDDFMKVEGLKIDKIEIKELLSISGSYSKGIVIPFNVKIGFGNIVNNVINIKLFNVNVLKLNILNSIKNFALKTFLKNFSEYGIKAEKDNITLDLTMITRLIPYVYFRLESLRIVDEALEAKFEELIYAKNKEPVKVEKNPKPGIGRKIQAKYSKTRSEVVDHAPDKYKKILEYALMIPDIVALLWGIFKDKRVNFKAKMMVGGILLYIVSPLDIIPDFIPFIGQVDDVAIAFFGLNAIINEVPEEVVLENWHGKDNIILIVREAVSYISKAVGSQNVTKIMDIVKNIIKKGNARSGEIEVKITDEVIEKVKTAEKNKIRE
jgi:uncharacterized membrane protein YkvA (DUF1232 family)